MKDMKDRNEWMRDQMKNERNYKKKKWGKQQIKIERKPGR